MELSAISMDSIVPLIRLQLEQGERSHLVVTGVSMHPTLRHCRDRVELVPPPQQLRRGDLILYQRENGRYILHRIITKPRDGGFFCAGDHQWEPEPVRQEQVIALVDTYIRGGKRIAVTSLRCRLYVWLLVMAFPIRKPLLKLRSKLGKMRKKWK